MNTQNIWRPLQFFMRIFNIKNIGLITLIIISFVMITEGCGLDTNKKDTSEVTIVIANNQQATLKIKKSTRFASLKKYFRRIIEVKEVSAAPFVITDIRYTVSGADMTTMTGTVSVSATTQTIVLDVPQGPQRHFILDAIEMNGVITYRGEADVDLNDTAVSLTIDMSPYNSDLGWPQQLGTAGFDAALGIAMDAYRNVYVAGYTYGGLDGNTNAGSSDAFLVKYDPIGMKLWTRQLSTSSDDAARCAATDVSGNVYVTGYTSGDLDGNTNAGSSDAFLVKYDTNGTKLWTRQLGTASGDVAFGAATDASGNVYVTGYTYGDLYGTNAGSADIFLVKYNSSGTWQWTRQLGTSTIDIASSASIDANGNIFITGYTYGDFGGTTSGGYDIFLVKYNSSGTWQWTRQIGTASSDMSNGVATDTSGNVYVTGYTWGDLDGNANAGEADVFLVKYDTNGTKQWTRQLGAASFDIAYSVATDWSGNVYVTGFTEGSLDSNANAGEADVFLVKYDTNGTKQWTRQFGTTGDDRAYGVTRDLIGNIFLSGATSGRMRNNNAGSFDIFLMKYNPDNS